jgi:hypothetical protein
VAAPDTSECILQSFATKIYDAYKAGIYGMIKWYHIVYIHSEARIERDGIAIKKRTKQIPKVSKKEIKTIKG